MPLYDYKCEKCKNDFELFFPLREWNIVPSCPDCGGKGKKQLTIKPGGVLDDHPVWLDASVRKQIQDTDNPHEIPITTRSQFNKHLKDTGITAL